MSEKEEEKKNNGPEKDPIVPSPVRDRLHEKFAGKIEDIPSPQGEVIVAVPLGDLLDILKFLKEEKNLKLDFLSDMTALDTREGKGAFELVYQLVSMKNGHRIRVKTHVEEGKEAPSATSLWPAANWAEREVYDMYGITFEGHPNPERILLPEDWEGFPLRKDYPLKGPREERQTPWNWYDGPSNLVGAVPASKKKSGGD